MKHTDRASRPLTRGTYVPGDFNLQVKRSRAGLGLFAGEAILKGACIIEYKGRTISKEEEYSSRSKYLFEISPRRTIDGRDRSNTARYINHSCAPNADPKIRGGRVFIMAIKNIKPGEELSYDYGKEYWDDHIKPHGCRCTTCETKKIIPAKSIP